MSSNSLSTTSMAILWCSQDDRFFISDSKELLSFQDLKEFLEPQHRWKGVTQAIWDAAVSHVSVTTLGVYERQQDFKLKQVGFSRAISDTRFTWLADFFILPSYRGMGLGKALLAVLLASPSFKAKRQRVDVGNSIGLQSLLQKYGGFIPLTYPDAGGIPVMSKEVPNECESHDEPSPTPDTEPVHHPFFKEYFVSTRNDLIQFSVVHEFLKGAYWSRGIEPGTLQREMAASDCISLFHQASNNGDAEPRQIGSARWVTDRVTFAYLTDVFVLKEHAGKGLGIWLVQQALEMPAVRKRLPLTDGATKDIFSRFIILLTGDAQGLYSRHAGFIELREGDPNLNILMRDSNPLSQ
ncbi:hypothetical protein M408DRAFT_25950 [Serendipita vermifera MAFF 305830]|uniref:N-acetyltransferase domain-containing protein n=1 Tax=Serendipita vermifera MAFF 305830 TaxID=933852 RepID=A0A0C2WHG6_SERVB|nr:hypothetical protein M408DRAFT_25950 [Serendipita vermifera MAFF 305830]